MTMSNSDALHSSAGSDSPGASQEMRGAVRFPIVLPMMVSSGEEDFSALTQNVSASGILFKLDQPLRVGLDIGFSLTMPRAVLGTPRDILVHCRGRVVRCSMYQSYYLAAATIDYYQFAER